jgi:dipeptidase D
VTKLEEANKVLTKENTVAIINLIRDIPTGVFTMIPDNIKIVESSDNLARIDTKDDKFIMIISMRSSSQKSMDDLRNKIVPVIEKNGANYKIVNQYPKWEYKPKSELRDTAVEVFKKMYGKDMETTVIHAGLECGVINEKYPDMDIISIGSDLEKVHTPEERASISSAQRVYEYLCELIKELK